jgi:hypothetical protein
MTDGSKFMEQLYSHHFALDSCDPAAIPYSLTIRPTTTFCCCVRILDNGSISLQLQPHLSLYHGAETEASTAV